MLEAKLEPMGKDDKEDKEGYEEYELECKARTLLEAAEIRQDEKLMAALKPYLEKKKAAINSLDDLRAVAKRKGA